MTWTVITRSCCIVLALSSILGLYSNAEELKIATFDTAPHDGLRRFLWSANISEIDVDIIQKTDDNKSEPSLIDDYLSSQNPNNNVMFCDSKFLAVAGSSDDIIERWKKTETAVLLDMAVKEGLLDLQCVLGRVEHVSHILKAVYAIDSAQIKNIEQFINTLNQQNDFSVGQDKESLVFLNMDRYPNMVGYTSDKMHFFNFETNDTPPILIGSTVSYKDFNRLTNYVPGIFDSAKIGIRRRTDAREYKPISFYRPDLELNEFYEDEANYPVMVTALFIKEDTPLLDMVLDRYKGLQWLSNQRVMMFFNKLKHREHIVNEFLDNMRSRSKFMAVIYFNSSAEETSSNLKMHNTVLSTCIEYNCTWIWNQDSNVLNIQFKILQEIAMLNFSIMAPLILSNINEDTPSANFWGDTQNNGFYKRSVDYFDIVERKLGGFFVVPYITGAYLVRAEVMKELSFNDSSYRDGDTDVVFCNSVRRSGHLMYLKANNNNGVFINGRSNASHAHPFFEHFPENITPFYLSYYMKWDHFRQRDWKHKTATPTQNPCEDVFVLELFSDRFTFHMKNAAFASNKWNHRVWHTDWEALQTLSFDDIGIANGWEVFSKDYLPTVVDRKFTGFRSDAHPIFSFFMKMTNDSASTDALEGRGVFTVLIPLTTDYEGGGIYFNDICKVTLQIGDLVIYPSRLTHKIRFIAPTNGTMVNIISFYN